MPKLKIDLSAAAVADAGFPAGDAVKPARRKAGGKTARFELRLSPSEAATLDRSARRAGLSRSDYVRSLIDGRTVRLVQANIDAERLDALLHELKKQGSNLNQIARRMNRGERIAPDEFAAMVEEHREAARKVADFIDETRPGKC